MARGPLAHVTHLLDERRSLEKAERHDAAARGFNRALDVDALVANAHFNRTMPDLAFDLQRVKQTSVSGEMRYRAGRGLEREHKVEVRQDFWVNHPKGSLIAVVYSKSKPSISRVKYQVEEKRKALAKRGR